MLETLQEEYPAKTSKVEFLVPKSNKGFQSYDGVRVGGLRVVQEVRRSWFTAERILELTVHRLKISLLKGLREIVNTTQSSLQNSAF